MRAASPRPRITLHVHPGKILKQLPPEPMVPLLQAARKLALSVVRSRKPQSSLPLYNLTPNSQEGQTLGSYKVAPYSKTTETPPLSYSCFFFFFLKFFLLIFIWLHRVLVASRGIFLLQHTGSLVEGHGLSRFAD